MGGFDNPGFNPNSKRLLIGHGGGAGVGSAEPPAQPRPNAASYRLGSGSAWAGQDLRLSPASKRSNMGLGGGSGVGGFDNPGFNPTSKRLVIGLGAGTAWAVQNPRLSPALKRSGVGLGGGSA